MKTTLKETIHGYLQELCVNISDRHVGSPGNRAATEFFANTVAAFGFVTECPEFDCIDWEHGDAQVHVGDHHFQAFVGPYSPGCHVTAPLLDIATLEELEQAELAGKLVMIRGELVKEQLMPKNFPFYNPEMHQQIIALLERKQPAAIIAATGKNPELAGALYPFPLIEDGDFDLPSVYMTDKEGERLRPYCGTSVTLSFESRRIPAKGYNVIARKRADASSKFVFCAHIDAKKGTPGALDNATGVSTLLALAELLTDYSGSTGIEIVALNGEDYYAASGQIHYLSANAAMFDRILLAVNLDGVGYYDGRTSFSLYGCPEETAARIRKILSTRSDFCEGDPWYQGDHIIFVQNQRPALAFAPEKFLPLWREIAHTEKDTPDLVDCRKLAELACGLRDLLEAFN